MVDNKQHRSDKGFIVVSDHSISMDHPALVYGPWVVRRATQTNMQAILFTSFSIFFCNDHTITEFGIIDSKNSSTAYVIWEFDRSHGAGTSSPSHWQQVEEQAPKPVGDVFLPGDLCSRPEALC